MMSGKSTIFSSFDVMASNRSIKAGWKILTDLTTNAYEIQQNVLKEILTQNAGTKYLNKFLNGHSDKQLFKDKVPIVNYEDIKPYLDRIHNGETSDIVVAEPIVELTYSSGTSGGQNKIFPMTAKELERRAICRYLPWVVINKFMDGLEQGKGMYFFFNRPNIKNQAGLNILPIVTSYLKSNYFEKQVSALYTSPYQTILCLDGKQSMYCQLLCGLLRRDEVLSVGSLFASTIYRAINFLKNHWRELSANIKTGQLSDWITDPGCRHALSSILNRPNPQLADSIEYACNGKSWEGIIKQLWPRTEYVEAIITGTMAQYIPTLEFYCGGLPFFSTHYASSECYCGINLEPLGKPSDVSYTLLPNMAFYEFLPVEENYTDKLVDEVQYSKAVYNHDCIERGNKKEEREIKPVELADVKLGQCYEIVVTTFSGLYRYKMGDILRVTGFHNNAPQFQFVRRQGTLLSIDAEKTTDEGLLKAVMQANLVIEPLGFILVDYTSYADISSIPGHYVLFWELKMKENDGLLELNPEIMEQCCYKAEETLDYIYRLRRAANALGPLEIRVVKDGTFDALMDFFISKGASFGQYKTPRCIKSEEALKLMDSKVIRSYFSQIVPPSELFIKR